MGDIGPARQRYEVLPVSGVRRRRRGRAATVPAMTGAVAPQPMPAPHPEPMPEPVPCPTRAAARPGPGPSPTDPTPGPRAGAPPLGSIALAAAGASVRRHRAAGRRDRRAAHVPGRRLAGCCCRCTRAAPGTTARTPRMCAPPTGHHDRAARTPCRPTTASAASTPTARPRRPRRTGTLRYVQAVVSCWGGRRRRHPGLPRRARPHRRALDAARPHRRGCASGWPPAIRRHGMYADPDAMLAEHPLTELACYASPGAAAASPRRRRRGAGRRRGARARAAAAAECCTPATRSGSCGWRSPPPPARCDRLAAASARTRPGTSPRRSWWPGCWPGWSRRRSGWRAGCCGCRCCAGSPSPAAATCSRCGRITSRWCRGAASAAFCGVRP